MLGIEELSRENGLFLIFIRIERGNALFCRTEFLVRETSLLKAVQVAVPGEQERCPVADAELVGTDAYALGLDGLYLVPEVLEIESYAVAENVHDAGSENAGRQKMKREFAELIDNGVACVAAALIPYNDVIAFGQKVHHTALSFVAPVDSYDCAIRHAELLSFYRFLIIIREKTELTGFLPQVHILS